MARALTTMLKPYENMMLSLIAFAAFSQPLQDPLRGDPLPRKGYLGISATPTAGKKGLHVDRTVPGGTAETLGLQPGDTLLTFNGNALDTSAQLVDQVRRLNAGDKVTVTFLHDGHESTASRPLVERPRQTEAQLDVVYDQVVSQGKRIRIILTKPKTSGKHPVLFMIGGIGAYSLDGPFPSIPYGNVLGPIANAGYVTARIDKPGQGDSEGPAYKDLTFNAECDAYVQALRLVKSLDFVDPDRVAIFGHSMGGCFGPLVASQVPVKALIVNGTLFKSFTEYMLENTRRQVELSDTNEGNLDEEQKQLAAVTYLVFDKGQSPKEVAKSDPELASFVNATFPDGETYSGVGIPFFRELEHTNLGQAWTTAKTNVLAVYSENDFLSGRDDHERIAKTVETLRPGTAEFRLIKNSDHAFMRTTSMKDSAAKWGKGGEFNPEIVDVILDFLKRKLG